MAAEAAADYELRGGLRHVVPYAFEFAVPVKGRWVGKQLLDHFSAEFPHYPREYYAAKIAAGWITLNGAPAHPAAGLRLGQVVGHVLHRHEHPVAAAPLQILAQTPEYLVINKPPSIPVHPCGRFRKNTVLHLLHATHGFPLESLHCVHRLDRLTGGLLIVGRSAAEAARIGQQLLEHGQEKSGAGDPPEAMKTYMARVTGRFPEEEQIVDAPVVCVDRRQGVYGCAPKAPAAAAAPEDTPTAADAVPGAVPEEGAEVELAAGGDPADGALPHGKRRIAREERERKRQQTCDRVAPKPDAPKPAVTVFRRHFYDAAAHESVVFCIPRTGRTHQIRLHLRSLGHPIANDPVYGPAPSAGGEAADENAMDVGLAPAAAAATDPVATVADGAPAAASDAPPPTAAADRAPAQPLAQFEYEYESTAFAGRRSRPSAAPLSALIATCEECRCPPRDPSPQALGIYLHAYRLELDLGGRRQRFETPFPDWAREPPVATPATAPTNTPDPCP